MGDPRIEWSYASEDVEDAVLTEVHDERLQILHRQGFCPECAGNHWLAQKLIKALWDAGWRPPDGWQMR